MKVLYILGNGKGGSNVSLKCTLAALNNKVTATVIAPNDSTVEIFRRKDYNCMVINYLPSYWPYLNSFQDVIFVLPKIIRLLIVNAIAIFKIIKLIKKLKPDVIHSNTSTYTIGYWVSRISHTPHVWHIREFNTLDFNYHPFPSFKILKRRLRKTNTIAISNVIKSFYELGGNCEIVYNGIFDKTDFQNSNKRECNYFLFVGSITEKKGAGELVRAFLSYLSKSHASSVLYLAGTGPEGYLKKLKEEISESHAADSIIFLGRREDIPSLMKDAKALIVPSFNEAFGRITAEAMFCYCLVIGKNTAGTKEQFDNGVEFTGNEIGIRYNSSSQLESALEYVDDDTNTEEFSKMRLNAFSTVNHFYSTSANADKILSIYKSITNSISVH